MAKLPVPIAVITAAFFRNKGHAAASVLTSPLFLTIRAYHQPAVRTLHGFLPTELQIASVNLK
jgi:hypothetical protein